MNYNYYPNTQFYMQDLQNMKDRIDRQMQQIQQNQTQQPVQQPQIHQSFQLAPQTNTSEIQAKYVKDINDVQNTFVMSLGMFVNKELDTLWLKNINGEIRTFALSEIIQEDPKDKEIQELKKQIEDMKGMILYERNADNTIINEQPQSKNATKLSSRKQSNAK